MIFELDTSAPAVLWKFSFCCTCFVPLKISYLVFLVNTSNSSWSLASFFIKEEEKCLFLLIEIIVKVLTAKQLAQTEEVFLWTCFNELKQKEKNPELGCRTETESNSVKQRMLSITANGQKCSRLTSRRKKPYFTLRDA